MRKSIRAVPRWAAALAIASAMAFAPAVSFAEAWVGDAGLQSAQVAAPEKDSVLPNKCQYAYAKEELAAFCHFGPNTMANVEWGEHYGTTHNGVKYETATEYMNRLKSFDAAEYVKTIKDAGFKRLIVTAKHHDGFRMWDSASSDYDMASTDSKIDVLAEISKECTEQGLDMGLYLSPWDIHDPTYGSGCSQDKGCSANGCGTDHNGDYNDSYVKQLEEILGNPKYGRDGKFVEIWMDGAKGTGGGYQEYDFKRYYEVIKKHEGEDCLAFQCGVDGEARWVGNEDGVAHDTTWNRVKMRENWDQKTQNQPFIQDKQNDPSTGKSVIVGDPQGTEWFMPECDARITTGWFWGPGKAAPKSMSDLGTMYFMSVGRGAPLLLNVPLDTAGKITPEIKKRVEELGASVRDGFADDLTRASDREGRGAATVEATSVYQNNTEFGPGKMIDSKDDTYWSAGASGKQSVRIKLAAPTQFDVVSIEEAIQSGQRIKSFKVSYRNGDSGEWKEFGSGGTVGAKRLVRAPKVTATEVKIELTPLDGKTVQLSEVGLFKMGRALEAPSAVPAGMETIDNTKMELGKESDWTKNGGSQFVDGTNMFSKKQGASASFTFTGSKFLIIGTVDPGHGQMKVTVDNGQPVTINTAGVRKTGQVLYASDTLSQGEHTVKIEVAQQDKAVAIDAAAVLNNGGVGMLEFAEPVISMDEDSTYDLKIKRTGGKTGALDVMVNFEPGTAVQGDFYTVPVNVKFADGETEKAVQVRTKRNNTGANATVNTQFSVTMTVLSPENLVLGPQSSTTVNIIDRDSNYTKEKLQKALESAEGMHVNEGSHAAWSAAAYRAVLVNAHAILVDETAGVDQYYTAIKALEAAKSDPKLRTDAYTAEHPFAFPSIVGETQTIEAELGAIKDDATSNGDGGKYPAGVKEIDGASGGKVVNALNNKDTLSIPFVAARAGEYEVTLHYMSGSSTNKVVWSDAAAKMEQAAQNEGADAQGAQPADVQRHELAPTPSSVSAAGGAVEAKVEGEDAPEVALVDEHDIESPVTLTVEGDSVATEAGVIVESGECAAGGTDQNAFKTATFTFKVKNPGASTLMFTGPEVNSPRIDKLDVKLNGDSLKEFGVVALAGTGGSIDPAGYLRPETDVQHFTVTPEEGYRIRSVSVGGKPVDVSDPSAPLTVDAPFDAAASKDLNVIAVFDKKVVVPAAPIEPAPEKPSPEKPEGNDDNQGDQNNQDGNNQGDQGGSDDDAQNNGDVQNPGADQDTHGGKTPHGGLPQTDDPAALAGMMACASAGFASVGTMLRRRSSDK